MTELKVGDKVAWADEPKICIGEVVSSFGHVVIRLIGGTTIVRLTNGHCVQGSIGMWDVVKYDDKTEKFWMVWNGNACTPPRVQQLTKEKALSEAERLSKLSLGTKFYVLEAVEVSSSEATTTTRKLV